MQLLKGPSKPAGPALGGVQPLSRRAPRDVSASLSYLVDTGERPAVHVVPPGEGESERTGRYSWYRVKVRDGRGLLPPPSLDREGFALVQSDTAVADFHDDDEVRAVYYREIEELVKQATGAKDVLVFDHTTRIDGGAQGATRGMRAPVRVVHNDYTAVSGPQRVRDLLPANEAEARLKGRFAVVNIWRPIKGPVETAPLAVADARSIGRCDFIATDIVYGDRTGEIYNVAFSPDHSWFHFPEMRRDEALLIKSYDSLNDGRARFTPHTAFDDPTTPSDAAPRESIEIRTLAFF